MWLKGSYDGDPGKRWKGVVDLIKKYCIMYKNF